MDTLEWMQNVLARVVNISKKDPEHRDSLSRCMDLEEDYVRAMTELPEQQRSAIDAYFQACQNVNMHLMRMSYICGLSDGKRRKK